MVVLVNRPLEGGALFGRVDGVHQTGPSRDVTSTHRTPRDPEWATHHRARPDGSPPCFSSPKWPSALEPTLGRVSNCSSLLLHRSSNGAAETGVMKVYGLRFFLLIPNGPQIEHFDDE